MKKSLYLLLLLLFPIGLQAQSEVIVLHPDEGKAEVNEAEYTRIFLAGTIDMGKSIDWQKATCDWFRARPQAVERIFVFIGIGLEISGTIPCEWGDVLYLLRLSEMKSVIKM